VDAVVDGVTRGEHQDWAGYAALAQLRTDPEAIDRRQHHVEHDRVIAVSVRHPERVLAVDRDIGGHSVAAQPAPDHARQLQVVFDDQYAHGQIVLAFLSRR
jgi:hypothetical protein